MVSASQAFARTASMVFVLDLKIATAFMGGQDPTVTRPSVIHLVCMVLELGLTSASAMKGGQDAFVMCLFVIIG